MQVLRAKLKKDNCIRELEILSPSMRNYSVHAAHLFKRDGFVVVRDVLSAQQLSALKNVTAHCVFKYGS